VTGMSALAQRPEAATELRKRLICRDPAQVRRAAPDIGCTEIHSHTLGGVTVYMACGSMGQLAVQYAKSRPIQAGLIGLGLAFAIKYAWSQL